MAAGALKVPTIYTAIDRVTAVTRKMTKSVVGFARRSEVALDRTERTVRKLTPSFRGLNRMVGGLGLALGGAALIGVLGNAIKTFADFEQANVNLTAVMGTTLEQNKPLIEDAKRLGATTSKTSSEVVALQEAYARLGFTQKEILDVTEATINGSVAMNAELAETAELTGAMIRTFDAFSSADAPEIMDQMTLATQKSALNFEKLNTALPIVAGAANAADIPFTKLLALLGKLSDAGIDASSSATSLRNIILESSKQGKNYDQILEDIVKNQDKLTAANDQFGQRGAVSGVILAKNLKETEGLSAALVKAGKGQENSGVAAEAAAKQLDTLNGSLTILGSAWEGFILSMESGEGQFGSLLKDVVRTATEILSLASGTAKAEDSLTKAERRIRSFAKQAIFFGKILAGIVATYIAANVALKVWRVGMVAFNIIQGIMVAMTGASTAAIEGNVVAMTAAKIATGLWTAAQWLLNIAMDANPIGLVILAIAALIALVALAIAKYDEWGAALTLVLGPLGIIINVIMAFRRNWEKIQEAFQNEGIIGGLKAIGQTLVEAVITPFEQLLQIMAKLPVVGIGANFALEGITKLKDELGVTTVNEEGEGATEVINPAAEVEAAKIERQESIVNENRAGTLTIENRTENEANLDGNLDQNQVKLSGTQGF